MKTLVTTPRVVPNVALAEFLLVVTLAFLPGVQTSIFILTRGSPEKALSSFDYAFGGMRLLASLGLLAYVWARRGVRISDRLRDFRKTDPLVALGLFVLAILLQGVVVRSLWFGYFHLTGATPTIPHFPMLLPPHFALLPLIYLLIVPLFEELIGRAFVIDEVTALTGRRYVAVLVSSLIGASYHLYQGWLGALGVATTFVVFAVYYARTGRVWPVILAHLYVDLLFWGYLMTR